MLSTNYGPWIDTTVMVWHSSLSDFIPLGDLLLFSHDSNMQAEVDYLPTFYENNHSSSLPDKVFQTLTEPGTQLSPDEIVNLVSRHYLGCQIHCEKEALAL